MSRRDCDKPEYRNKPGAFEEPAPTAQSEEKTIEEEANAAARSYYGGELPRRCGADYYLGHVDGARREREKLLGLLGEARDGLGKIAACEGDNCGDIVVWVESRGIHGTTNLKKFANELLARIAAELEKP